jgi:hypothetical protein
MKDKQQKTPVVMGINIALIHKARIVVVTQRKTPER